jgi:hypothetical protein
VELTTLADIFGALPEEDRDKFDVLVKVLQEQLSGVKVYKVGGEADDTPTPNSGFQSKIPTRPQATGRCVTATRAGRGVAKERQFLV